MRPHRRDLIAGSAAAFAFTGLARSVAAQSAATEETYVNQVHGYGPLLADPHRLLDLPEGFSYEVISQGGDTMDDGLFVPGQFDGMGCFQLDGTRVALVRNHELKGSSGLHRNLGPGGFHQERIALLDPAKGYDTYKNGRPLPGGTTTLVYDLETRQVVRQFLSLSGTSTNCCGGHTPWGSWLTCEETVLSAPKTGASHGWIFEVPAEAPAPDNEASSFQCRVQNAPNPTRVSPPPLLASSLFCSFRGFVMMMLERWTLPSSETLSR